jgi:hypothetical protein
MPANAKAAAAKAAPKAAAKASSKSAKKKSPAAPTATPAPNGATFNGFLQDNATWQDDYIAGRRAPEALYFAKP